MAGCSFLVLEGVDGVRGNALRCSPGGPQKRRFAVFRSLGFMVLQQKNLPPGGFSELCESEVCWELFLLQKVPQAARQFVLRLFPSKGASNAKVFRTLRRATSRRCPLDTRHLLKKVDENFYFANSVPRGRRLSHPLNQYVNWVRHHAA